MPVQRRGKCSLLHCCKAVETKWVVTLVNHVVGDDELAYKKHDFLMHTLVVKLDW